jgi:hypothetical protein
MAGGGEMTNQISNWAGGGATVTEGAIQAGYGQWLGMHNPRPNYNIPDYITQNYNMGVARALQGDPQAIVSQERNSLDNSAAYSLSSLGDLNSGIRGVSNANNQLNNGNLAIDAHSAATMEHNKDNLYGLGETLAGYKDKQWDWNNKDVYLSKLAESQGFKGAGMNNISQGFQKGNTGGYDYGSTKSAVNSSAQMPETPAYR